ncbi:hypothetical protein BBG47_05120 [Paenibacillus sp. KS1]|nr:hypothetical protein BBG47_05120 [Paenibacillus sp. KS1]
MRRMHFLSSVTFQKQNIPLLSKDRAELERFIMSRCRKNLRNKFIAYENEMQYTTREDDIMLQSQFEHKMISRGLNFPDFDFTKDNLDRICIGLHLGYSEEQLMKEFSISQAQWKKSIDLLYGEGLAKKVEGLRGVFYLVLSFFIYLCD